MDMKAKGSNAERELIRLFWENGFAAVRAAGSGSTRFPSPDIIVSNKLKILAIECKATKGLKQYLSQEDIDQLLIFSKTFGAQPWIGVRFNILRWYFLAIEDLEKTPTGFVITINNAKNKGLLFEELIKNC